jgi:iron complex transport system ATP-binding protein
VTARLAVEGLSVDLAGRRALDALAFELPAGRLVALVGPNGAGKTTLLRALAGLLRNEGGIALDGRPLLDLAPRERARRVAYLPQGHQAHWPLTAREIVALGRFPHGASDPAQLSEADARAVERALSRADALAFADRDVLALSGGERARVMLARVLAVEAGLLLADEPTAALDPRHQILVMETLAAEAARGALVIAATHDLGLAARHADLVLALRDGQRAALGTPRDVLRPQFLRDTYGVEALLREEDGQLALQPWRLA